MKKKAYIRDKRSPVPKNATVSKVMSKVKAKNTKPELILRQSLYADGIRGYRLNYKGLPGRPDLAFIGKKIAIFVNGCYWHRCPKCDLPLPKNNTEFWTDKFARNRHRDKAKTEQLKDAGWQVITLWECDISKNIAEEVNKIKYLISKKQ